MPHCGLIALEHTSKFALTRFEPHFLACDAGRGCRSLGDHGSRRERVGKVRIVQLGVAPQRDCRCLCICWSRAFEQFLGPLGDRSAATRGVAVVVLLARARLVRGAARVKTRDRHGIWQQRRCAFVFVEGGLRRRQGACARCPVHAPALARRPAVRARGLELHQSSAAQRLFEFAFRPGAAVRLLHSQLRRAVEPGKFRQRLSSASDAPVAVR